MFISKKELKQINKRLNDTEWELKFRHTNVDSLTYRVKELEELTKLMLEELGCKVVKIPKQPKHIILEKKDAI